MSAANGEGEEGDEDEEGLLTKKEVICRCAGSLAAPANWRFVRGADMVGFVLFFLLLSISLTLLTRGLLRVWLSVQWLSDG